MASKNKVKVCESNGANEVMVSVMKVVADKKMMTINAAATKFSVPCKDTG